MLFSFILFVRSGNLLILSFKSTFLRQELNQIKRFKQNIMKSRWKTWISSLKNTVNEQQIEKKEPAATWFQFQFLFQLHMIVIEAHNVALLELQMHESASVIAMQTAN